jgi:excisionase family DNA binding protein
MRKKNEDSTKQRRGPEIPGLVRVDDAAKALGVSPATIWKGIGVGRIPHVRILNAVRIRQSVLDALIVDVPARDAEATA